YADWHGTIGEVIAFGPCNGREIVAILLIDDGVADRGHRINLLNPDFRYVGIAIEEHPEYGYVCVIDFAADYDPIDGTAPDTF
ncbi:MAG: CAP domain-containing protein, partial [Candidatus Aegiribacteria sp.]